MPKKIIALLTALILILPALGACNRTDDEPDADGGGNGSSGNGNGAGGDTMDEPYDGTQVPDDFVTLIFYYPGEFGARFEEYMDGEYAEMLKRDLNCEIEMRFQGWGDYWTKKDVILAASEDIDLWWDGLTGLPTYVGKGYCRPLDELVDKYGYGVRKVLPDEHLDTGRIDGVLYGIPSTNAPLAEAYEMMLYRTDIADELGMGTPMSPETLAEYYTGADSLGYEGPANTNVSVYTRYYEHKQGLPQSTNIGSTMAAAVREDDATIFNRFDSEAYYASLEQMRALYEAGLINDDLLINKNEIDGRVQAGRYVTQAGASIGKDMELIDATRGNAPEAALAVYDMTPEAPKIKAMSSGEVLCMANSGRNPERTMMWLSWLYGDRDNYYASLYGVEGVDYKITDGALKRYVSEEFFFEWMFRVKDYMLFNEGVSDEYKQWFLTFDDDAVYSKVYGFYFDTTATDELIVAQSQLTDVLNEQQTPLELGMMELPGAYDKFLADLKSAGVQTELDEVKLQWAAWSGVSEGAKE